MIKFIKLVISCLILISFVDIRIESVRAEYSTAVPLTLCDKEYIAEMKVVLAELVSPANQQPRSPLRANIIGAAKRYMLLLKRYQELEYKIKSFENVIFPPLILSELERPYYVYSTCRMDVLQYNTGLSGSSPTDPALLRQIGAQMISGQPISPIAKCENLFNAEMERTLEYIKSKLVVDLLAEAKEYMQLFKQYEDTKYNLQLMDKYVFTSDITARLRLPLLAYTRCQQTLKTKTFSTNVDRY